MIKKLIATLLLCLMPSVLAASTNIYIAPAGAGDQSGLTDCTHAKPYTYFNSSGSWSATPSGAQIGPNVVVNLCSGTYTVELQLQGDGSSGNPVTIRFMCGALASVPAQPGNGFIYGNGTRNWITVDGNFCGIIESTNNGSAASGFANQVDAGGIYFPICNNCEITGFKGAGHIGPIYQHNSSADTNNFGDAVDIHGGSNNRIDNNIIYDSSHCITYTFSASFSNLEIDNNVEHNCNWGAVVGDAAAGTLDNFTWHNNEVYDWVKWDNPGTNCCHHNGLHLFLVADPASRITNFKAYSNYGHGDPGTLMTSFLYIESNNGINVSPQLFNNITWFVNNAPTNASVNTKGNDTNVGEYNNLWGFPVFITGGKCIENQGGSITMKNNTFINCGQVYYDGGSGSAVLTASDYNDYYNVAAYGPGGSPLTTFAAWKGFTGGDTHSIITNPNLDSNFVPILGSPVIGTGVNLSGLSITGLNIDKNGNARRTNWSIGPIEFQSLTVPVFTAPQGFLD